MTETIRCGNCGMVWTEEELDPVHDYWGRVQPGGVVPLGQCPCFDCKELCYPPYGFVYELQERLAALEDVLTRLLEWEQFMGGWEGAVWDDARRIRGTREQGEADEAQSEQDER